MADFVFYNVIHLAKGFQMAIRHENRIIAMPLCAAHRPYDLPLYAPRKNLFRTLWPNQR